MTGHLLFKVYFGQQIFEKLYHWNFIFVRVFLAEGSRRHHFDMARNRKTDNLFVILTCKTKNISFNIKNNKQKLQKKFMSVKELNKANTTKASVTRGSVYTIHKYIEHIPNNPPAINMRYRQLWECIFTSCHDRILDKETTRTIHLENILKVFA